MRALQKCLTVGCLLLAASLAQAAPGGQIDLSNAGGGVDAPVTDARTGEFAAADDSFRIQLYAGPDPLHLQAVPGVTSFIVPGYFAGDILTIPQVPGGTTGAFQVVVWEAAAGATYEQAVANSGVTGASVIFDLFLPNPADAPPPLPATLTGLMSFVVNPALGPRVLTQPQNQVVTVGETAVFSVTATGGAPLTYQWRLAGANLPNAINSTLTIPNAALDDAGQYSVRVTDPTGTIFSQPAMLRVLGFVQSQIEHTAAGGTVVLPAGTFTENIVIGKNLTLMGSTGTILDGGGTGNVVRVDSGAQVMLSNMIVRHGGGAGIYNLGALRLVDVVVSNNSGVGARAGGLWNEGQAILADSQVEQNGDQASSFGGGLFNGAIGNLTISNCWIFDNRGFSGGLHNEGTASIINSTLSANRGSFGAGAIGNYQGSLQVQNSTISGNSTSSEGGALYNFATASFEFCTLAANEATMHAGGIWALLGTVALENTILADNSLTGGAPANCLGLLVSNGHNLLEETNGCRVVLQAGDLLGADPRLAALADNGGPGPTHALMPGSAALDAGSCGSFTTDERGISRLANAGPSCDIGAFELPENLATERHFVLSQTLGVLRNNFSGNVGVKLLAGSQPITVVGLGRMFFAGNTGSQTVRIVRISDLSEVARVEVVLNGGAPGQFQYGHLATPVILAPNTAYYLVSVEVLGANLWADYVGTILNAANVAAVQGAVYSGSGYPWTEVPGGHWSYGPLDFLYLDSAGPPAVNISAGTNPAGGGTVTGGGVFASGSMVTVLATANPGFGFSNWTESGGVVSASISYMFTTTSNRTLVANFTNNVPVGGGQERPLVVQRTLGSPRNDFTGQVGTKIRIGNESITVTALARMFFLGNTGVQTVRIVRASDLAQIASVSVNMTGGTAGLFQYAHLASPVVLAANTSYYLVSSETFGGNLWADYVGTALTVANVATVQAAVYFGSGFGWTEVPGGNLSYVPCDLLYLDPTAGPPVTVALSVSPLGAGTVSGGGSFPMGSLITALASANPGFGFANWTESGVVVSSSANYMFNTTSNRTLVANFTNAPVTFNITTASAPANGGTTSGGGNFASNAAVTVIATANSGFGFANWTQNGTVVSGLANYTFNAISNRVLTAHFTNSTPGGGAERGFVVERTLGSQRNDFNGHVGMRILVGAQSIQVTGLGRMFFAGNTGVHTVRIVRVSDLTQVATVDINMNGGAAGQFQYGHLASPILLSANTAYYIVSLESLGGDRWADYVGTLLTVANVAAVQGAVYFGTGFGWTEVPGNSWSYVPCDFLYLDQAAGPTVNIALSSSPAGGGTVSGGGVFPSGSSITVMAMPNPGFGLANWTESGSVVSSGANYIFNSTSNRTLVANFTNTIPAGGAEQQFITTATLGTLRSDAGSAGFQFTVGPHRIIVSALARMGAPGNSRTHELKLLRVNGQDVPGGAVTVNMVGTTPGQFAWANLASPVILEANTIYQLVSAEGWFTDSYYDWTTTVTTTAAAHCDGAGYIWYGWNFQGAQNTARGPLNFRYQEEAVPGGGGVSGIHLAIERDDQGELFLHLSGTAGATVTIESSGNFQDWVASDTVTLTAEGARLAVPKEQGHLFWRSSVNVEK